MSRLRSSPRSSRNMLSRTASIVSRIHLGSCLPIDTTSPPMASLFLLKSPLSVELTLPPLPLPPIGLFLLVRHHALFQTPISSLSALLICPILQLPPPTRPDLREELWWGGPITIPVSPRALRISLSSMTARLTRLSMSTSRLQQSPLTSTVGVSTDPLRHC